VTTFSTRQTFALIALFVATSLAFIQLDNRRALEPVKDGLNAAVAPAADAFGRLDGGGGPEGGSAIERELAAVKAQRDLLMAENAELKQENRQIEQLQQQARLQQENPRWKMIQARVRSTDPTNFEKSLILDKGSDDGVREGMAVVAGGKNYIGQITEVQGQSAKVMLVIDSTQTIGARLESGADGVVFGMWQNSGRLELRYLERDAKPEIGMPVLTADNGTTRTAGVPGNLLIGVVEQVEQNRQGDLQTVPIMPQVDFEQLQVVTIVLTDES
jgi:rod shape-determining protein MreC